MLTYLFKQFRGDQPVVAEPRNDLVVVDDKDEDDYCEITVRPKTWSEVAGSGVKGRVIVSRRAPSATEGMPAIAMYPAPRVAHSLAPESNELYGDVEEELAGKLDGRVNRRRKVHRQVKRTHLNMR